jgi:hypothetical protein
MAHHFLKNYFLKNIFLLNDLDLLLSTKKILRFFFRKYLQKITNIIFTCYQKFSDWQKLTENFQNPNFYIFIKLNLFPVNVKPVNVAGSMDDIWLSFKNKNWSDVKPVNVAESMDDI